MLGLRWPKLVQIVNKYTSEQIMLHSLVCMVIGFFVTENLTDSGRTAGGDRKELGGSKQEGRCGWVKLITVMISAKFTSTK